MQDFDSALTSVLTDPAKSPEERRAALVRWAALPEARFAQPREEHLLPLHVVRTYLFYAGPDLGYRRGGLHLLRCIWCVPTLFRAGPDLGFHRGGMCLEAYL